MMARTNSAKQFQSTLPAWGETAQVVVFQVAQHKFQSTLPAWGETERCNQNSREWNFNPLSPHGERRWPNSVALSSHSFQSTLPAWGETERTLVSISWFINFNPLSPHGERRGNPVFHAKFDQISIHSPRMGRDFYHPPARIARQDFNPFSPHGERPCSIVLTLVVMQFQSTLPAWGETQYPRHGVFLPTISIHSPRMGRDAAGARMKAEGLKFQSTLPAWGETQGFGGSGHARLISIHSPRMGRDWSADQGYYSSRPFQSTLPAWGETQGCRAPMTSSGFQSTLPAWGETKNLECRHLFPFISIHSPRMGRDVLVLAILQLLRYFNPLSPHGERQLLTLLTGRM